MSTFDNMQKDTARLFGVVVLNYNDYNATIACVRSLVACDPAPGYTVVVDNDSPNESRGKLVTELGGMANTEVISSGRNGGYSFGNNVGIRRLRELGYGDVVIATSDTEVVSRDLFARLDEAIGERTGIVAPQIIGPFGYQNPSVGRLTLKYLLDLWWVQLGMPGLQLRRIAAKLFRPRRMRPYEAPREYLGATIEGEHGNRPVYKLHGSFMCLTKQFLEIIGGLNERIFMFGEEDLLAWACFYRGFEEVLVESAYVRHTMDTSISMTWGADSRKFTDLEQRKSGKVLRGEIDTSKLLLAWIGKRVLPIVERQ